MRSLDLGPAVTDDDLWSRYDTNDRTPPAGRPWVLMNMVASLDGATALAGVSGGLGGEGDRTVFGLVRSLPDVIVVAAGTVRAENYGPPQVGPEGAARRRRRQRDGPADGQQLDQHLPALARHFLAADDAVERQENVFARRRAVLESDRQWMVTAADSHQLEERA